MIYSQLLAEHIKSGGLSRITERVTKDQALLGYLRYEKLRKMSPLQFGDFFSRCLTGEKFDDIIDEELINSLNLDID